MSRTKASARKGQAGRDAREARKLHKARERAKKAATATPPVKVPAQSDVPKLSKKEKKRRQREDEGGESDSALASIPPAKRAKSSKTVPDPSHEDDPGSVNIVDQPLQSPDLMFGTDADHLVNSHEVTTMNIISSSKVEAKVTTILEALASFSFTTNAKPNIIKLHAKASTGSKLISIVEIAKRNIASSGGKWYQYNQVGQVMEEKESAMTNKKITTILGRKVDAPPAEVSDEIADSEEVAFESMKTPFERALDQRAKVRAVPTMTIYLSRVGVQQLKSTYGEQTNAPPA